MFRLPSGMVDPNAPGRIRRRSDIDPTLSFNIAQDERMAAAGVPAVFAAEDR
jgi:hypothetical protein